MTWPPGMPHSSIGPTPVDSWDAADAADNLRADITRALVDDTDTTDLVAELSELTGAQPGPAGLGYYEPYDYWRV
jgi:hypothetical protein